MHARIKRILQEVIGLWKVLSQLIKGVAGYDRMLWDVIKYRCGGGGGIRTLGTLSRTAH
jgi:hypothetical protein